MKYFFSLFFGLIIFSACDFSSESIPRNPANENGNLNWTPPPNNGLLQPYGAADVPVPRIDDFKDSPAKISNIPGHRNAVTFNNDFTNHYGGVFPRAPVIRDDPTSRTFTPPRIFVSANLGSSFENKLPDSIKDELQRRDLLGKDAIDIFWVAQSNIFTGEEEDHSNVPTTSRLTPHAWADPNAPANYSGTRVNRNFLMGIFESDQDISTAAFPLNTMTESPVHTHDGLFSPRPNPGTNQVKLSSNSPSLSFWSLVIDHNRPDDKVRAIATLHWFLQSGQEGLALFDLYQRRDPPATIPPVYVKSVDKFSELMTKLEASPAFNTTPMLAKLKALVD